MNETPLASNTVLKLEGSLTCKGGRFRASLWDDPKQDMFGLKTIQYTAKEICNIEGVAAEPLNTAVVM